VKLKQNSRQNGKPIPVFGYNAIKTYRIVEVKLRTVLTSALHTEASVELDVPAALSPGEEPLGPAR